MNMIKPKFRLKDSLYFTGGAQTFTIYSSMVLVFVAVMVHEHTVALESKFRYRILILQYVLMFNLLAENQHLPLSCTSSHLVHKRQ